MNDDDIVIAKSNKTGKEYYIRIDYCDYDVSEWTQRTAPIGACCLFKYRIGNEHGYASPREFLLDNVTYQYEQSGLDEDDLDALVNDINDMSVEELEDELRSFPDVEVYNIYMYEHGGVSFSLSDADYPFNDPWDSGQIGWWVATKEEIENEIGKHEDWAERFHEHVKYAIQELNDICRGSVWRFTQAPKEEVDKNVTALDTDLPTEIKACATDSLGGFIGNCEDGVKEYCAEWDLTFIGVV